MPPMGARLLAHAAAYPSLMLTVPARRDRAMARAARVSRLAMAAFKPYSESLARTMASASEPTGYTDTTGPKVSIRQTSMSSCTPVRIVGSKKYGPMSGRGSPPTITSAPSVTAFSTWAATRSR